MDPNILNNGGYAPDAAKTAASELDAPATGASGESFPMPPSTSYGRNPISATSASPRDAADPKNSLIGQASQPHDLPADVEKTMEMNVPQESPAIEVEWVSRVDSIVDKTTSDPYAKANQLALLKSEYLKKVYGKEIEQRGQK